jgi:CysZ protein
LKNFILGIKCHFKALKFLVKHKFWWYSLVPFVVFTGIYSLGFYLGSLEKQTLPSEGDDILKNIWYYLFNGIVLLLSYALLNFTRYIVIILISPVLSTISQRTEKILTGNKYKFNLSQLFKDIIRAVKLAFRNIVYEFSFIAIVIVTFWIIGMFFTDHILIISMIEKIIIMMIAFYYYGFAFLDYTLERMRFSVEDSVKYMRKHRGLAISIGIIFTPIFHYSNQLLLETKTYFEPNNNWFYIIILITAVISAIVPVWSMIASTMALNEIEDLKNNEYAIKENQ